MCRIERVEDLSDLDVLRFDLRGSGSDSEAVPVLKSTSKSCRLHLFDPAS
jgi:hypothetical protein